MPLKLINGLATVSVEPNGFYSNITANLRLPGTPVLMAFCCDPVQVALRQKRQQTVMRHGEKLWFPCVPIIYEPSSESGSTYTWQIARCQCGLGSTVTYLIGQLGAPPILQWHSLPHQADSCKAVQIDVTGLGQFAPIPYPPGGALTGGGSVRNHPLDWELVGCVVAEAGTVRIIFNGVVKGSPLGPPSTKVTLDVQRNFSSIDTRQYQTADWPGETSVSFTVDDTWSGPGAALYRVLAGYDATEGLGGAQGDLTFMWMPP